MDDWVSACRKVEVTGARKPRDVRGEEKKDARCRGRERKTWKECVDNDMKVLGLHPEWAVFRDVWRDFIWANV